MDFLSFLLSIAIFIGASALIIVYMMYTSIKRLSNRMLKNNFYLIMLALLLTTYQSLFLSIMSALNLITLSVFDLPILILGICLTFIYILMGMNILKISRTFGFVERSDEEEFPQAFIIALEVGENAR